LLPFCPCHFVRTILSVPFCPIPFCPVTTPTWHRRCADKLLAAAACRSSNIGVGAHKLTAAAAAAAGAGFNFYEPLKTFVMLSSLSRRVTHNSTPAERQVTYKYLYRPMSELRVSLSFVTLDLGPSKTIRMSPNQ